MSLINYAGIMLRQKNNIECQDAIFLRCNNLETKLGNLVDAGVVFDLD